MHRFVNLSPQNIELQRQSWSFALLEPAKGLHSGLDAAMLQQLSYQLGRKPQIDTVL